MFCISAGFLFRLQAGGEAYRVDVSEWLFLSVFLLSIFLSNRRSDCSKKALSAIEPAGIGSPSNPIRTVFLDGIMYMTGGAVLVNVHTVRYRASRPHLHRALCCFGLLRYIYRVKSGLGGDPTESLLKGRTALVLGVLWAVIGRGGASTEPISHRRTRTKADEKTKNQRFDRLIVLSAVKEENRSMSDFEQLTYQFNGAVFEVNQVLGAGFLEKV